MKLWYRFVCAFVAVAVVLFSVRVPDVDADEDILNGDKLAFGKFESYEDLHDNLFLSKIGNIDDYYFIFFSVKSYEPSVSTNGVTVAYIAKDDYKKEYLSFSVFSDSYYTAYNYSLDLSYFTVASLRDSGVVNFSYSRYDFSLRTYNSGVNAGVLVFDNALAFQNSSSSVQNAGIYTNLDINAGGALTFTVNPELSDSMDMNNLNTNFTIDVENETDNAYNYCIYISSQPASVGIVNSLQSANYFLSSTQWCYVFQQDYQLDADLIDQIKNNVSDNYTTTDIIDYLLKGAPITNLTNVWGGVYNGAKEYISLKNSSMSFYSLVQTNCPVYAIGSNATKTHVVDYACLNVNLDTQYYLNIIYYHPDMNIVAGIGSSTAALVDAAYGESGLYPIYNVDFFRDYTVYDSIPFSFVNGTFSISEDDVTKYNDVVQNSNPANSTANISSDDDNVNINNSNSYDSSVKTNYYNYGTIYHNCSWSGSGSSSSGARPSVPELPESEFENLYDQSGNFFDFVADVLDAVGAVPMLFITAAFAVLLFLRIWGR
ncbi:MAG: hypothetical protein IJP18_04240 [Oscillospiraceae bacterium]|nr:hypothetical protein [Oscillospiraceae bacterium]